MLQLKGKTCALKHIYDHINVVFFLTSQVTAEKMECFAIAIVSSLLLMLYAVDFVLN